MTEISKQETVPYKAPEQGFTTEDEALDIVEVVQSENGVIYIGTDTWCHRVTLSVPMELLKGLAEAWAAGDDTEVISAVRDMLDGQDGELGFLSMLGIRP